MQLNSLLGKIKADFQTEFFASLLQSHNPSEILLKILFSTKKTFIVIIIIIIIINVEKSWEYFFLGFLGGINWKNSNDCYICYSYIYCYIYIIYIKLLNGIVVYIVIETS